MAWRIDKQVLRGEIDNRTRGRVSGKIWLVGKDEPVVLDLKGNGDRDLAGRLLRFSNPDPEAGQGSDLMNEQRGWTGDLTASRKVKVPDCSVEEMMKLGKDFPWHWANGLYLEWFSEANGRVVIESVDFELELSGEPVWDYDELREEELRKENGREMLAFAERLEPDFGDHGDDDDAQSEAEAEADEEAARMDQLLDRVTARLDREGTDDFERVLREERERMRKERGEPEIEVTPEMEAERQAWIEEMNAVAAEVEAEKWKDEELFEQHPLVERATDLAVRLHKEAAAWIPDDAQQEHPLLDGISAGGMAAAKLGGALGMGIDDEWPPDEMIAGNVVVRLKKSRGYFRDVLSAMDSAGEGGLAPATWILEIREEVGAMLGEVERLLAEARGVLGGDED